VGGKSKSATKKLRFGSNLNFSRPSPLNERLL
jgi:hypothetical protein